MEYTQVLLKPLITEKTSAMKEASNQVAFLVHPKANKLEVKYAVEKVFNVKVLSVNIVRKNPMNKRRQGRVVGKISGCKKAYLTLAPEAKIELFEGV